MKARAAGFTLVELIAAIAVIAILAALLMAGLGLTQERANATQCVSNLRQLALANLSYAADHDSQYVTAQEPTNLIRWHGVRDSAEGKFDPTRGPLAPYLGTDGRVKRCPSLKNVLSGGASFEDGTGGYGYNAAYIGGTPLNIWAAEHTGQVERPAQTVMFTDTAFPKAEGLQEYAYCEAWQTEYPLLRFRGKLSASVHFRHLGRANVAWCDGHVTAEQPAQLDGANGDGGDGQRAKIGWFGPSTQNGYWRPY